MIGFRNHITVDVLLLVLWRITKSWAHHLWGRHLQAKIIVQSQVPTTESNSVVPTKLLITLLHVLEYNKNTIHVYVLIFVYLLCGNTHDFYQYYFLYVRVYWKERVNTNWGIIHKRLVNTRWWLSFKKHVISGFITCESAGTGISAKWIGFIAGAVHSGKRAANSVRYYYNIISNLFSRLQVKHSTLCMVQWSATFTTTLH